VRRRLLILACLAAASLLSVAVLPGARGSTDAREGGIFRVSFQGSSSLQAFDYVDPALAYRRESWALLDTVCARLMRYRDTAPPDGYRMVPEVAAAFPKVSRDGKTTTFTLRSGFRFSDGTPVRADAFAHAIDRTMAPGVDSPAWLYTQAIVGAADVKAGKRSRAAGVTARGNTLTVRFTREVRDFAAWTTMPFFCAVPPTLPASAEGVRTFPGAGPYTIREYRRNERIVLGRNRYYGGQRAHHVDGFHVDLSAGSPEEVLDRIEAGKADWGYAPAHTHVDPGRHLIAKYRLDQERYFIRPGLTVAMFVLNSSRTLFKDNPRLRRAVNLALKRDWFTASAALPLTDHYLPSPVQGFRDRRVYPLDGDPTRAKALAAGNLRDRKAVFYVPACAGAVACVQFVVKEQLEALGLEVEIRPFPEWTTTSAYLGRMGDPDEPWDLALIQWTPDFVDPFAYINRLLDGRPAGGTDLARFDEPFYRDLMRKASRLQGAARGRAYAELDLRLTSHAAPVVPIYVVSEATLVSARVAKRCMLLRPGLVLTTVCLKR
jgi:ABC-type oligopeptide transport system substrate-binding subunit